MELQRKRLSFLISPSPNTEVNTPIDWNVNFQEILSKYTTFFFKTFGTSLANDFHLFFFL